LCLKSLESLQHRLDVALRVDFFDHVNYLRRPRPNRAFQSSIGPSCNAMCAD
jgi:hypothetical protein